MSDDEKTGTITITVPFAEYVVDDDPTGRYDGSGWYERPDGERGVHLRRAGRETRIRDRDVVAAVDRAREEADKERARQTAILCHNVGAPWDPDAFMGQELRVYPEKKTDPAAARIAHLEGLLRAADAALEALGVENDGRPIAERIEALRAADLAAVERVAAAYPADVFPEGGTSTDAKSGTLARHVLGLVREEMAKGPLPLTDAEMAAHRGLDAPTRADDEPDPETGWTRAEMRAASSPATRDFLAAMDKLRGGGSEADGLEAFKAFLRAEHPR